MASPSPISDALRSLARLHNEQHNGSVSPVAVEKNPMLVRPDGQAGNLVLGQVCDLSYVPEVGSRSVAIYYEATEDESLEAGLTEPADFAVLQRHIGEDLAEVSKATALGEQRGLGLKSARAFELLKANDEAGPRILEPAGVVEVYIQNL